MTKKKSTLFNPEFPRSNRYDPDWVMDGQMGPNALWLMEWLTREVKIRKGMRVLDLGCGKALSSVFLAREFQAQVWAVDLWVDVHENWKRIKEAGAADLVCPIHAEAHGLPFAEGFFDVIVSADSYTYYGTDDLYLFYISRFVRPGGTIGVVVPGLTRSFGSRVPPHLSKPQANGKAFWEDECNCFHTAPWWREHWKRAGLLDNVTAETQPHGWRHWRDFENALEAAGKNVFPSVAEALGMDRGRYIGFVRVTGRRKASAEPMNLYDPALLSRLKMD